MRLIFARARSCITVTFKQTLGSEMMEALKTLIALGLTSKEAMKIGASEIVPYDVVIDIIEANPRPEGFRLFRSDHH